jgi:enoyl-CoA hydratase/carnithine racemase
VNADARVRCDVIGPIATVTLNRPDRRNAQTPATWAALRAIGCDLPAAVRVVVVRGEGSSFSAGLDHAVLSGDAPGVPSLFEVARAPTAEAEQIAEQFQEAFSWLRRPEIVSLAVVQGHAVGAGFQLALACDLRLASDDAQFRMAETSLGLVPDLGGTGRLTELLGYSRALEICITGRSVDAKEAGRIGLVNAVVARADLSQALLGFVDTLLAPSRPAVTETKSLLLGAGRRAPAEQLLAERRAQLRRLRDLAGTRDAVPGPTVTGAGPGSSGWVNAAREELP